MTHKEEWRGEKRLKTRSGNPKDKVVEIKRRES